MYQLDWEACVLQLEQQLSDYSYYAKEVCSWAWDQKRISIWFSIHYNLATSHWILRICHYLVSAYNYNTINLHNGLEARLYIQTEADDIFPPVRHLTHVLALTHLCPQVNNIFLSQFKKAALVLSNKYFLIEDYNDLI